MMNYQGQITALLTDLQRVFNLALPRSSCFAERINRMRVIVVSFLNLIPELFQEIRSGLYGRLIRAIQFEQLFRELHPRRNRQTQEALNKSLDRIRRTAHYSHNFPGER